MATVQSFEELNSWQKARNIARKVHALTRHEPFCRDFALRDQMSRSSGSVMDNIAEGFGRSGNKELVQFLVIARGSASELKSQLYRAWDKEYLTDKIFQELYDETDHVCRMLTNHIEYLKTSEYSGLRYKKT